MKHASWDGWRPIEQYEVVDGGDDILISRRTYGVGLDEILKLEQRVPGQPDPVTYYPVYDSIGNMVALLDAAGEIVERYDYSPYGERFTWHDDIPPSIEQVRLENGDLVLELSEPIRDDLFDAELGTGIQLQNLTQATSLTLSAERPVLEGRQAKRRIVLEPQLGPNDILDEGDVLQLTVPDGALQDFFDNVAVATLSETLTWSAAGQSVVVDTTAPEVEEICLIAGKLVVDFSEPVDEASLASQLLVDGAPTTWTVDDAGYSVELASSLETGSHMLDLGSGPLDLAGLGLSTATSVPFEVESATASASIESAPFAGESESSAVGNPFGFHGLPVDVETGLLFVRHRYLDPEIGRFTTKDPLGYVDGPSAYAFAGNSPVNYSDPLGLYRGSSEEVKAIQRARTREAERRRQEAFNADVSFIRSSLVQEGFDPDTSPAQMRSAAFFHFRKKYGNANALILANRLAGGPSGLNTGGLQALASEVQSDIGGAGEVYTATLDLILAVGPAAGAAGGMVDDGVRAARGALRVGDDLADAIQVHISTDSQLGSLVRGIDDSIPEGTVIITRQHELANLHYFSAELMRNPLPHFTVETLGGGGMHTHQVRLGNLGTTMVRVSPHYPRLANPTATVSVPLPDPAAAKVLQQLRLNAELGAYCPRSNSCLTNARDVLRAGGADIPEANAALRRWVRKQLEGIE